MGSSLPNHDAKGLERIDRKETKENQGQTASNKVREKATIENITLYDA